MTRKYTIAEIVKILEKYRRRKMRERRSDFWWKENRNYLGAQATAASELVQIFKEL